VVLAGRHRARAVRGAAVAGVLATAAAHQWRCAGRCRRLRRLDVGQPVHVENWNADGTARVAYRGTQWTAELAAPDTPRARTMYIVAMRGSILVVADRRA
jgi:membrane protein implicated in regulation of membrane protease activity